MSAPNQDRLIFFDVSLAAKSIIDENKNLESLVQKVVGSSILVIGCSVDHELKANYGLSNEYKSGVTLAISGKIAQAIESPEEMSSYLQKNRSEIEKYFDAGRNVLIPSTDSPYLHVETHRFLSSISEQDRIRAFEKLGELSLTRLKLAYHDNTIDVFKNPSQRSKTHIVDCRAKEYNVITRQLPDTTALF